MKTINFKWTEINNHTYTVYFSMSNYYYGGSKYISVIDSNENEVFCDLTINIPTYILNENEIIINGDVPKSLLKSMEKEKLIKITRKTVKSGFAEYMICEIDYDKLKEYSINESECE